MTRFEDLDAPIIFDKKAEAVMGDLRPMWRLSLLVMILHKLGHGGKASLEKIHVISWALRNANGRARFLRLINSAGRPDDYVVRFEPALNRAIQFAEAEGLVIQQPVQKGLRISLTGKGRSIANRLERDTELLAEEREFLETLRRRVTESIVQELFQWGGQ